jgi:23S rRNA (cytosine1962-C5)-methyltransferase
MDTMITFPEILDGEDKSFPLKNCLRNNYRHIRKWAKRTQTTAFRIYDKEIPWHPLQIDYYDGRFSINYFSKDRENPEPPENVIEEVSRALYELFGAEEEDIYWRSRIRRRRTEQYEKVDEVKDFFTILEYGVKFKINLVDYLDTGLFLDHRETRALVASKSKGKRLLNLFAYTASFSVHAAMQGALSTKSVDMSNTYTDWGRDNFLLNDINLTNHASIRDDCLKFLEEEIYYKETYDIIVIDPPTISRSKKMDQLFDVQIDYIDLIHQSLKLLAPGGTIFFSTNSRRFRFDVTEFPEVQISDISLKTIPLDFYDKKIHYCWIIKKTLKISA